MNPIKKWNHNGSCGCHQGKKMSFVPGLWEWLYTMLPNIPHESPISIRHDFVDMTKKVYKNGTN